MVRWMALVGVMLMSCAVGEAPPPTSAFEAATAGPACEDPRLVLESGNDGVSSRTLECWRDSIEKLWAQVQGAVPNQFTDSEVRVLLRSGILELPGPADEWFERYTGLKELLGIDGPMGRSQVTAALTWMHDHRSSLRRLFRTMTGVAASDDEDILSVTRLSLEVSATLFTLMSTQAGFRWSWDRPETQIVWSIQRAFNRLSDRDGTRIGAWVRLLREGVSSVCPDERAWGTCLTSLRKILESAADALDQYVIHAHGFPTDTERKAWSDSLRAALDQLATLSAADAAGVQLSTLDHFVDGVSNVARGGQVLPLSAFSAWISAWSGSPGRVTLKPILAIARGFLDLWDLETASRCLDCAVGSAQQSEIVSTLRNRHMGEGLVPHSPAENRPLLWIHALTQTLIETFDRNGDGLLTSDQSENTTLAGSLIDTWVSSLDFMARVRGQSAEIPLPAKWAAAGMGELLAIVGADVAPRPSAAVQSFRNFVFNFYHVNHPDGMIVDRVGLSAISVWLLDWVIHSPAASLAAFPRTQAACTQRGNCASLLASLGKLGPTVQGVAMATVESVWDACDLDVSGVIEVTAWSSADDEGGCMVKKIRSMVLGLMNSSILKNDPDLRDLLSNLDSNVFKTMGAKVALARGTQNDLVLHVLFPPSDQTIRLDAVLALLSEILSGA